MKRIAFNISILLTFFISTNLLFAQTDSIPKKNIHTETPQMDVLDYLTFVKKKPVEIQSDTAKNNRSNTFYIPLLYPGYALVTGLQIVLTTNVSFYAERSDDAKLSSILMNNIYSENHQLINVINSNIWTAKNKFNFIGDLRYYKFPTNTYGLGSTTYLKDEQPVDYSHLKIYEVAMAKIANNFSAGMGCDFDYHWNISETKNSASDSTVIDKYGFAKKTISSGITLNFEYDSRLNVNNPNNGAFVFLELRNNLKAIGSDNNWESVLLDARKYIQTSKKSGNVLALWSYNWITVNGNIPYLDLPSLGWDAYNNTGRGYVQGRFRGWNMIYDEAEYRYRITKNGLLGGVFFVNASTFTEFPSDKFEKINPGAGLGIRIKANKSSNTNVAIDYGFGSENSRGFAFNLNEVF